MSRFAEIADRCNDENFKKIYTITSNKLDRSECVEDGIPKAPLSFSDKEVNEIKELQFETVKANYTKDGGFKTLDDVKKEVSIDVERMKKNIVQDGFYNPGSGIGTSVDVGNWGTPYEPLLIGPYDASAMYSSGGLSQIIIDKKSQTPSSYPRPYAKILKKPL